MKICGIIAEYNPMHSGHIYQITQANADYTVVVMSGNFVQRGTPALWDKWTRAKIAVQKGADLVLELPVDFAVASAERFALGGVSVLNRLGLVTHLCFGAESPLADLQQAANALSGTQFEQAVQNADKAIPYHLLRNQFVENESVLQSPNNILGIEYLKALHMQNSNITPQVILRKGAGYHDVIPADGFTSATHLRRALQQNEDCASFMPYPLPNCKQVTDADWFKHLQYRILQGDLENIAEVREGIHNRIYECALQAQSLEDLIQKIKTKRYTETAIRRMLLLSFLGIKKEQLAKEPCYTRVLAANRKGCSLLRQAEKNATIPLITKGAHAPRCTEWNLDVRAGNLYSLLAGTPLNQDYRNTPYIERN